MKDYYVVSFSGGKDSTAMLLRLLELGQQIDEVVFCDTYKEFPQMYKHIDKVKKVVEEAGIKFTTLKSKLTFDQWMFDYEVKRKNEALKDFKGKSWADFRVRWCTKELKTNVINKYFKELSNEYKVVQYVGLAADETARLQRANNKQETHKHPLVDWGWSEADCLSYCYSCGYDWEGLYNIFRRVSCWCCPLQPLEELRKLYKYFPQLWDELKEMDARTWRKFKPDYSVQELEQRFKFEDQRTTEGKSIRNREFYNELKEVLRNGTDTIEH